MARGRARYRLRDGFSGRRRQAQAAPVPFQQIRESDIFVDMSESFEITEADLSNHFYVTVTYGAESAYGSGESSDRYPVIGRQSIKVLGKKVAYKLWEDNKVLSSQCAVDLYENGALADPATTLAEIMKQTKKERRGDGVSLTFRCIINGFWGDEYFD